MDENSWIQAKLMKLEFEGGPPSPNALRELQLQNEGTVLPPLKEVPGRDFVAKVHVLRRNGQRDCYRINVPKAILSTLGITRESIIRVQWERTEARSRPPSPMCQRIFCRICGRELRPTDRFCDSCGSEVVGS